MSQFQKNQSEILKLLIFPVNILNCYFTLFYIDLKEKTLEL